MFDVTEDSLGVWVAGSSVNNPFEFNIKIVEAARFAGMEINKEVWERDCQIFLKGEPTFDMIEDLGFAAEAAVDYLQSKLPEGFYFEIEDGLILCRDEEQGE